MNKFDKLIKDARVAYDPDPQFVDKTMKRIRDEKPRRRHGFKVWAPSIAGIAAVIAVVFVAVPKPAPHDVATTPGKATESRPQTESQAPVATAMLEGTDDASLENDLHDIQASIRQADGDQSDVESALGSS